VQEKIKSIVLQQTKKPMPNITKAVKKKNLQPKTESKQMVLKRKKQRKLLNCKNKIRPYSRIFYAFL